MRESAANLFDETMNRIEKSRQSEELSRQVLDGAGERIKRSRSTMARGSIELERFRTLGCSTVTQQAYRRSRSAVLALLAIESAFRRRDGSTASSQQVEAVEGDGRALRAAKSLQAKGEDAEAGSVRGAGQKPSR